MKKLACFLVFVPALVLGCPPDIGEGEVEGEGEGEGEGEFNSAELVDALLSFYDRCLVRGAYLGPFYAEAEPATDLSPFLNLPDRQDLIDYFDALQINPALDFDPPSYAACLAVVPTIGCADLNIQSCNTIFSGNREVGDGCAADIECADTVATFCDGTDRGDVCGACTARPGVGDPCDFDLDACAAGLLCSDLDTSTCVRIPGDGEPCPESVCAGGFACDNATETCEPPDPDPSLGDPCVNGRCNTFQTGLACDATSDTCVDVTVVQPGETCDPQDDLHPAGGFLEVVNYCINQAAGVNTCADTVGDGTFTCTVLPGDGDACLQGDCTRDASCDDTNQCNVHRVLGESCSDFGCALSFTCNENSICEAKSDPLPDLLICAE